MTSRTARCTCGALSLETVGEPVSVSVCHCGACRSRTGSAFSVNARFPSSACTPRGPANAFTRQGDSGKHVRFHFCPACGSTVYWEPEGLPGFVVVAVGAFGDQALPAPTRSVYDSERLPWVTLPESVVERY